MPHDRNASPDELYERAVGDGEENDSTPQDEPGVVESNSSNYGGSAVADKPIEDRVLHEH